MACIYLQIYQFRFHKLSIFVDQYLNVEKNDEAMKMAEAFIKPPSSSLAKANQKINTSIGLTKAEGFTSYIRASLLNSKIDTFKIDFYNQKFGALTLSWENENPSLRLVTPRGDLITPTSANANPKIIYDDTEDAAHFFIENPINGTWKIIVADISNNAIYNLKVYGDKPQPVIQNINASSVSATRIKVNTTIQNPDSLGMIYYFVDSDTTNYDGQLVGRQKTTSKNEFTIDCSGIKAGDYYVYGMLKTGASCQYIYAQNKLTISDDIKPAAPKQFKAIPRSKSSIIHFQPSTSPDVWGYKLVKMNLTSGEVDTLDIYAQNRIELFTAGDTLAVFALAYDHSMNHSSMTPIVMAFAGECSDQEPPQIPSIQKVEKINSDLIRVSWQAVSDAEGYVLNIGTLPTQYYAGIDVGKTTEHIFPDLAIGSTYYFSVYAYDNYMNDSDFSTEQSYALVTENDIDSDGMYDDWEYLYWGSLNTVNEPEDDFDDDLLTNIEEMRLGTSPIEIDTDHDLIPDGTDQHPILNIDLDNDKMPDDWEIFHSLENPERDADKDSLKNVLEYQYKTNPNNPDTDGDGTMDGLEVNAGTDPTIPGDGNTLLVWPGDTNNDGIVNQVDVLSIGFYWKHTGPKRSTTNPSVWEAQQATPWQPDERATFADANGDGIVNQNDVLSIGLNWKRQHALGKAPVLENWNETNGALYAFIAGQQSLSISMENIPSRGLAFELDTSAIKAVALNETIKDKVQLYHKHDADKSYFVLYSIQDENLPQGQQLLTIELESENCRISNSVIISESGQLFKLDDVLVKGANEINPTPDQFNLYPAYPNPFNPQTTISYSLPSDGAVQLDIFNLNGKLVKSLTHETTTMGMHHIVWDATNNAEQTVSAGVYLIRLKYKDQIKTQRIVFTK